MPRVRPAGWLPDGQTVAPVTAVSAGAEYVLCGWTMDDDDVSRVADNLSRNLRALRGARGLTQQALAEASGVPRAAIAACVVADEGSPPRRG